MDTHKNARLTPRGREEMVRAVVDSGLSRTAAARRYNTTSKTVAKWVQRFRAPSRLYAGSAGVLWRLYGCVRCDKSVY
jgi:transposase-like protein